MNALSTKSYVLLALMFIGIAAGGFVALIALDRLFRRIVSSPAWGSGKVVWKALDARSSGTRPRSTHRKLRGRARKRDSNTTPAFLSLRQARRADSPLHSRDIGCPIFS